ncbi:hypothetical protein F5Y15DRAFT_30256 [Xylariaceae sp. FL0016]|nr:hypothetical protein F5Y15DRAFT_30256 [Xylariaceae sp. FL0016]
MPIFQNGKKMACEPCIRGHRSTNCTHADSRVMLEVRKPGRPLSHCPHITSGQRGCSKCHRNDITSRSGRRQRATSSQNAGISRPVVQIGEDEDIKDILSSPLGTLQPLSPAGPVGQQRESGSRQPRFNPMTMLFNSVAPATGNNDAGSPGFNDAGSPGFNDAGSPGFNDAASYGLNGASSYGPNHTLATISSPSAPYSLWPSSGLQNNGARGDVTSLMDDAGRHSVTTSHSPSSGARAIRAYGSAAARRQSLTSNRGPELTQHDAAVEPAQSDVLRNEHSQMHQSNLDPVALTVLGTRFDTEQPTNQQQSSNLLSRPARSYSFGPSERPFPKTNFSEFFPSQPNNQAWSPVSAPMQMTQGPQTNCSSVPTLKKFCVCGPTCQCFCVQHQYNEATQALLRRPPFHGHLNHQQGLGFGGQESLMMPAMGGPMLTQSSSTTTVAPLGSPSTMTSTPPPPPPPAAEFNAPGSTQLWGAASVGPFEHDLFFLNLDGTCGDDCDCERCQQSMNQEPPASS